VIFPCIDLLGGKVVQLIQGREKALECDSPDVMLQRFAAFPEIQVIDLDAAMGTGDNGSIVAHLATKAKIRAGGGVRTIDHVDRLLNRGVWRVIIGTAAFGPDGVNRAFLDELCSKVDVKRLIVALDSKDGKIVVKGWQESTNFTAEQVVKKLEPYCGGFLCTYVDKEGMMQGTDLDWFRRLRAATNHEITAAGGITTIDDIKALAKINVNSALGMAIYTGRLDLGELASLNAALTGTTPLP
jgi:phosphoribosylformimino-5-aminoimidazole carboxamide ribotide isomerase